MKNTSTRTLEIDMEKCVSNTGNYRFDMVLIASQRTRELKRQMKSSGLNKHVGPVDALLEIQAGKLNYLDYMRKVK
jgi:DNA-directed RNA polymerase subunit K/omega